MTKRLKVLILADDLGNGGAERQLALLGKYIPQDWEGRIWSMTDGPFRNVLEKANLKVDVWERKWRFDLTPTLYIWRLITEWSPDIVHAWGWMSCLAAIPLCRVLRIPIINGTIRSGSSPKEWKWIKSLGISLADGVIANSRAGLAAYHVPTRARKVVYNGFDPERIGLTKREINGDKLVVVMVARMVREKDFRCFIDAARCLGSEYQDVRFLAIGNGPERINFINYAGNLVERGIMKFPDANMEVLPLIRSAHVGVLMTAPKIQEGCSNALIEYMACKLPIICTYGGGNQEIVLDGQTGFLVQPGDSGALVENIKLLNNNREQRQMMGEAGYQRFLEMFSVERMVDETVEFYRKFLK